LSRFNNFNDILVNISQKSLGIIRDGMLRVMTGDDGTANHIKIPGIKMAGKTGTSQNPFGEDHSIFICFAPFDDPQIAVAVIVENAGFGSTIAAPIAREIIKAYLFGPSIFNTDYKEDSYTAAKSERVR
jgi:penicillin-binding protein 2